MISNIMIGVKYYDAMCLNSDWFTMKNLLLLNCEMYDNFHDINYYGLERASFDNAGKYDTHSLHLS